ncbi:AAA family ATPase [Microbacterium sp. CIAB417]|uniref:AAA family ATPase n=1 Tax=Microbacterium sp. CIAB417 TaxID=2860287 RepID=UPI001FAE6A86|nr:SMC family ATPase [Microbacterium sp. CIAB417]
MRLHRLEVEGFGPFRERQTVDFDAFAQDGIFLIAGRTGAGKSSILDAICFGLYGAVPRYDGGEKRLRSDHCEPDDPSEVVVEFSTTAGRFRVTRSPEYQRPAKRGGGMTKQASAVALDEWTGDGWVGRAARAVDVAHELDEILQLSQSQFLQVILLAQNRFARFLLADSRERQALLRRLFGTERFEDIQARFEERRRRSENDLSARFAAVGARLEQAEDLVTTAGLWGSSEGRDAEDADADPSSGAAGTGTTEQRIDALRRALARAGYRAERASAARDDAERAALAADAALTVLREERTAQQERDRARAALALLDDEQPQIARAKEELDRARRAESLRPTITALRRADEARAAAAEAEVESRASWDALGMPCDPVTAESLEEWAAERMRLSGTWERAAEYERQATARRAELEAARERVAAATTRIEADDAERAELPARRVGLIADRDAARRLADRADDLARDRDQAADRQAAAAEAERLAASLAAAERAYADAGAAFATAQTTLAQLLQRRLDGMSGELAQALVPGEACPVCGATEHPAPAAHTDPVTAEAVEAAQQERDAAAAVEREAAELSAALRAERSAAEARADGRTPAQAEQELATAIAAHDAAVAAAARAADLDERLAALDAASEQLERRREDAATALAVAREELAVVEEREREAEALIAEARGAFDSVAERMTEAAEQIRAARAFADALGELARRTAAADAARAESDAAVADSDFDDETAVEAALRSDAECEALEARISAHAVQRESEKRILLPLELRALPDQPIDVAPAEEAAAAARTAWTEAMGAASAAQATAEQLSGLIDAAVAEHERSAALTEEHEVLRGLADTIAGRAGNTHRMTLETFVLAAELEEIVAAANRRLSEMSTGRYQLHHSDALAARGAASGLGIVVFDAFTGRTRPAQSLSGGETFLSSLALALGLAEVVTGRAGGITLDTLFIDEGFGSLDADTLEVAMRTLDELRSGGRTVGVISHVEAMQEQIPAQLRVEQTDTGPSRIVQPR